MHVLIYFAEIPGLCDYVITDHQWWFDKLSSIGGGKGGARGLKPPLGLLRGGLAPPQNDITRNYLSWSGAENRDKDRDTLIEQSL